MTDNFQPIETDVKQSLTKVAEDVEKGYPEHLHEISERAEKVVADGTTKADEHNAATIKKILDDLDSNSSRTDIPSTTKSAESAEHSNLTANLRSILAPNDEPQHTTDLTNHINTLRTEGHAPGRHLDPDEQTLKARLGTTKLNPDGTPKLKVGGPNVGHVASENFVDPMTGTTTDIDTGNPHRCGPYSTKFDNPEDMARADDYFRAKIAADEDTAPTPIAEILGPDGHRRVTGFYKDPSNPSRYLPVDFEGGTIRPVYRANASGGFNLITMFPEPVPGKHP